jgi:membrane-associated phospholipid phosphatase
VSSTRLRATARQFAIAGCAASASLLFALRAGAQSVAAPEASVVTPPASGPAKADPALIPSPPEPNAPKRATDLRLNVPLDLGITIVGGVTWFSLEFFLASAIAPSSCAWCDRRSDGSDNLNGLDRSVRNALRWSNTRRADLWSTVFSFGLAPVAGLGVGALIAYHDDRMNELPEDILVVAEAGMLASNFDEIVKLVAARERPSVHFRTPERRAEEQGSGDNVSFFSGHATLAFSLAVSAGTVASMRRHRLAPLIWVTALTTASVGGYLRLAADKHYFTDVLTGAAVGSAVGFAVPYFFHGPKPLPVSIAALPLPGGGALNISGLF